MLVNASKKQVIIRPEENALHLIQDPVGRKSGEDALQNHLDNYSNISLCSRWVLGEISILVCKEITVKRKH